MVDGRGVVVGFNFAILRQAPKGWSNLGLSVSANRPMANARTRTNTNPNDTEANAAGRSGNARALRKQSKCGVYHEGEGHWPKFSQKL